MYVDQVTSIEDRDNIYVYYRRYQTEGEFTITGEAEDEHGYYCDPRYTFLAVMSVEELSQFADPLPKNTRWEQVQFLWEIFQANQSETL